MAWDRVNDNQSLTKILVCDKMFGRMNRHFDFPFQTRVSETEITKICIAPLLGDKPGCFSHPETSCNTDTWRGGSLDNPRVFPGVWSFGAEGPWERPLITICWKLSFQWRLMSLIQPTNTKYHIELSTSANFQNVHLLQPFSGFRSYPKQLFSQLDLFRRDVGLFHIFNNSLDISKWKMLSKQKC